MSVTFHRNFALPARLEKRIKFSSTSNSLDSGRQQSSYNATCTWCMFYSSAPVQSIRRLNLFQSHIIILIGGLDWIISPSFQYKSTVMSRVYREIEKRDEKKEKREMEYFARWSVWISALERVRSRENDLMIPPCPSAFCNHLASTSIRDCWLWW